jgi:PAS domain S-box-containing protein
MSLELVPKVDPAAARDQRHVVQFYEDDAFLAETVATLIGGGIVAGEPVVVIATEAHRAAFCERLRAHAIDVERACAAGQLVLLDARATLEKLMIGDEPDWDRFRAVIGGVLDEVAGGNKERRVRAYGEMVDLLWRDGNRDGAIRLEEHWNELARAYSFDLLCAYVMDNFYKESDSAQFARICGAHTHARPTERIATVDDDARLREIALLEQRALALHNEVERRKKTESELRRSEHRLQEFVENAVVPLHWVDADGKILWANKAELELLGYSAEEYVGHHIAEFHVERAVIDDILARLSRHETLREFPSRLRCKDGSIRHVLIDSNVYVEDGKLVHTRCFTRDVTARLEAEKSAREQESLVRDLTTRRAAEGELRESEMRMRLLIDSIRDYAIFMLDPEGHVSTWNPGAQRFKGYQAHEIIGRHFSVFYPREDVDAGKCELELRVAAQTGRFEDEGWRVRKDGSRFWANVVISAVRNRAGELVGFAKVTRDLTDRRRAEDERAALAAAEQANRAKDEFLAMLGHELRNPLAPIVTALQLMKLRGDTSSAKEQVIIERQVQHVVRLVDDLLDVSRITQGKIELKHETFELATVVAKAVEIAGPLLEQRRHALSIDVPRHGMRLHADPVRLAQVVANLLTNAAKYTDVEGRIAVAAWRDGHEVVLQVKDNGVGIRAELLPRMFDLFVQGPRAADRSQGGLGIGLTLVRSLVQMHGGTVVALSDGPGQGSAFVMRLPGAAPPPAEATDSKVAKIAKASAPRRVLVVDDNVDAASLLAELCTMMGHEVKVAHDGPQALALLEDFSPEVAVLDIGLPVMDGYELAKRMREKMGPSCRLVALTGYGQEHDRRRSEEAGFAAHLVKPVDPQRVLSLIDESATPG